MSDERWMQAASLFAVAILAVASFALLSPLASGACGLTLAGLYVIWCARLNRVR